MFSEMYNSLKILWDRLSLDKIAAHLFSEWLPDNLLHWEYR